MSITDQAIKYGYLIKEGQTHKTWRRRFFVLEPEKLTYYCSLKKYKGEIQLNQVTKVIPIVGYRKKSNCLELETSQRVYHIYAPTEEEIKSWYDALLNQIQN
eukprot:TRINITY_DN8582_c0_g1_i1.p1 TRINITY_DN8582_c0_g1~~TRINITY_DN8582_c0_g1_i1.p1  ORF type:complete len:102 (-),score=14.07 TRINITY_DN8582_c0_g1_i1:42-347(-)